MKDKTILTALAAIIVLAMMPKPTLPQINSLSPDAATCFSQFSQQFGTNGD